MKEIFHWNDRELLRYLGCKNGTVPDQNLTDLIAQCKQELEQAASLRVIWREYPLCIQDHSIDMTCLQTQSKSLERNLKDCERVLLFAATLGSRVDVLLHRYNMIQMSKAVVMQAASVAMLETFCDEQNQRLKEEYEEKGWYLRPRFSPGYGDFSIEYQRPIVQMLDAAKKIGLTLTDSCMMVPSKSVTAVIGISETSLPCHRQGCEICTKTDCLYRRNTA